MQHSTFHRKYRNRVKRHERQTENISRVVRERSEKEPILKEKS